MAADFDDDDAAASSYKGKQRFSRKGTLLLPPEEVRTLFHNVYFLQRANSRQS